MSDWFSISETRNLIEESGTQIYINHGQVPNQVSDLIMDLTIALRHATDEVEMLREELGLNPPPVMPPLGESVLNGD